MSKEFRDLHIKADLESKRGLMRGGSRGAARRLRKFKDRESGMLGDSSRRGIIAGARVDKLNERLRGGGNRYERAQQYLVNRQTRGLPNWSGAFRFPGPSY